MKEIVIECFEMFVEDHYKEVILILISLSENEIPLIVQSNKYGQYLFTK